MLRAERTVHGKSLWKKAALASTGLGEGEATFKMTLRFQDEVGPICLGQTLLAILRTLMYNAK